VARYNGKEYDLDHWMHVDMVLYDFHVDMVQRGKCPWALVHSDSYGRWSTKSNTLLQ